MGQNKLLDALASAPIGEPDAIDSEMLAEIDAEPNREYIAKEDYEKTRTYNGNISLRIPKELHRELVETAKEQGVSLNQYCLYRLARQRDHSA